MAVENAKFQVDQTRANLEASRQSFDKASERLAEGQKAINRTIAEMTNLEFSNASLESERTLVMVALALGLLTHMLSFSELLPVLKRAVGAFTSECAACTAIIAPAHHIFSR